MRLLLILLGWVVLVHQVDKLEMEETTRSCLLACYLGLVPRPGDAEVLLGVLYPLGVVVLYVAFPCSAAGHL